MIILFTALSPYKQGSCRLKGSMATLEFLDYETMCSICMNFFSDPVTTECGHSFCRKCIMKALQKGNRLCPECRSVVVTEHLRPDRKLANITDSYKQLMTKKDKNTCKQHLEKLQLFCVKDNCPICVVCHTCGKHRGHEVMYMEGAVEQYKEILTKRASTLRGELKAVIEYKHKKSKQLDEIKKSVESRRKGIISEFDLLRRLLNDEENRLLSELDAEEKMSTQEITAHLTSLSEQSSAADRVIKDLEQRLTLQDAEFLRDIHSILKRTNFDLQLPEEQPAAFQIDAFSVPPHYLIWKKIKRQMNSPDRISPVLDQNTAHRFLSLSKDKSTVRWMNTGRKSFNRESFSFLIAILSCEGFSSKRYLWNLEVEGLSWALGIVKKSVIRDANLAMIPANGFWVLSQDTFGKCYAGGTLLRLKRLPNPVQLAVYLDYEGGQLTIYRTDTLQHIYTFQDKFTEKIFPFFYLGKGTTIDLF